MTARYLGMSRDSGQVLGDLEHIRQSVRDILITPVGSRVMRRDYGSLLRWEPRITLTAINLTSTFDGKLAVDITGVLADSNAVSLSVPVS